MNRIAIVGFWLALSAAPALSQTVPEKLCILSAAQKLPNIPGLSIAASRVKPSVTGLEAASILVDSDQLKQLNHVFDFVSQDMLRAMEITGRDRGLLTGWLADKIKGNALVELDVKAAAQDMTFTFLCAWSDSGRVTAAMGVSR